MLLAKTIWLYKCPSIGYNLEQFSIFSMPQSVQGPHLTHILGLGKNRVSWTIVGPLLMRKSPTCRYISKKAGTLCKWGSPCILMAVNH